MAKKELTTMGSIPSENDPSYHFADAGNPIEGGRSLFLVMSLGKAL